MIAGRKILLRALLLIGFLMSVRNFSAQAILSGSMDPSIRVGSVVISEHILFVDLMVGDIVTYQQKNDSTSILITHRVTAISSDTSGGGYFETKGDANTNGDPYRVGKHQLVGRVVVNIPYLGSIVIWMRKHSYLLVSLGLFYALGSWLCFKGATTCGNTM
jgi:signal peptidase